MRRSEPVSPFGHLRWEDAMRIPNQVQFLGKRRWPEFDCSEAPLPDSVILRLWMLDGAERRHHLAKRWFGWHKTHLEQLRQILIAAR